MTDDRIGSIQRLLIEAERAHGVYETSELGGVYDQDWPRWYAGYAVDHDIEVLLGHPVSRDELTDFLARTNAEFESADPKPLEPWADHVAARMATEL